MENGLMHKSALCFASKLNLYIGKEGLDFKKMLLGTEILLINISKLVVMYLLAAMLGVLLYTVVIHLHMPLQSVSHLAYMH